MPAACSDATSTDTSLAISGEEAGEFAAEGGQAGVAALAVQVVLVPCGAFELWCLRRACRGGVVYVVA